MTRVSLKEAYDNKDVVAQIYAIRDIAEGAEDTANNAVSTANTASEHVDALVPQVEGAVQNANNASSSAQQSATTVAGYDTRLTTAEGDIDALQSVQGDCVKKTGAAQTVTSQIMVPTTATGVRDTQIANGTRIQNDLDNYAPMARLSDYQVFDGIKVFDGVPGATNARNSNIDITAPPSNETIVGQWAALDKNNQEIAKMLAVVTPTGSAYVNMLVRNSDGTFKAVRIATGD